MRKAMILTLAIALLTAFSFSAYTQASEPATKEQLARIADSVTKLAEKSRGTDTRITNSVADLAKKSRETDTRIANSVADLGSRVNKMRDSDNEGAKDVTARMVLYRFLVSYFSTAIRLQPSDKPVFTKEAFWRQMEKAKVKAYVQKVVKDDCLSQMYAEAGMVYPTMLSDWLAQADEVIHQAQPGLDLEKFKKDLIAAVLKEVRAEIRAVKDAAKKAQETADKALAKAEEASRAAVGAVAHVAGKASQQDLDELRQDFAKLQQEFNELRDSLFDAEGYPRFASTECVEAVFDSLDARIKTNSQMIGFLEEDTYLLSDKKREESRMDRYTNLLKYYGNDHLKVQKHLRRRLWSEKHIREAAEANGGELVIPDP